MAEPKSDDGDEELLRGPSLGADGRMERFDRVEAPVPLNTQPSLEPLELAQQAPPKPEPRVEVFRELPPSRVARSRSAALTVVLALLALAVLTAGAFLFFRPQLKVETPFGVSDPTLLDQLNVGERPPIIISSVPTGAKVLIAGEAVGETPWAGDNRWRGTVKLELQLPGYRPFQGELQGGKPVTLDVKLKR